MMVDLGQYAVPILSAYAGTIVCLVALVIASVVRARRIAKRLADVEARRKSGATS
ncbi:heme exporter protein CcmD [Rhodobacteraceae bacterium N5(2021)]|uniref:Heme exporter protein D n=2 Tax=Gymnodinialimonas phycosphaerae TaxID=2841589 RepID=A0A975YHB3_9RHOB|nr:heme exporter protein CcmD [Gymnodinialimonas phycosphaerae]